MSTIDSFIVTTSNQEHNRIQILPPPHLSYPHSDRSNLLCIIRNNNNRLLIDDPVAIQRYITTHKLSAPHRSLLSTITSHLVLNNNFSYFELRALLLVSLLYFLAVPSFSQYAVEIIGFSLASPGIHGWQEEPTQEQTFVYCEQKHTGKISAHGQSFDGLGPWPFRFVLLVF